MGYLQTVLGIARINPESQKANHSLSTTEFLRLIAKKIFVDGKLVEKIDDFNPYDFEPYVSDSESDPDESTMKIELYNDLINHPEKKFLIDSDEYDECLNNPLAYKKCQDIHIGTSCCFVGIIIDVVEIGSPSKLTSNLEYRIKMAKMWVDELDQQSRIDKDEWYLVLQSNCCS
uniref:Uncharacterized protein n=1 Tax=Marseillevirus LCMAC102 TaxID=2506603 RepID=A0A481YSU5_9VIRU|nr:MAG: hypothetical protein LCMAC102_00930 [Marseillevirus LCMAC102]